MGNSDLLKYVKKATSLVIRTSSSALVVESHIKDSVNAGKSGVPIGGSVPRKRDALTVETAERVIERDGGACVHCFSRPAHIHHRGYRSRFRGHPELNSEKNLVLLCPLHHAQTHAGDPEMARYRTASWQKLGRPRPICESAKQRKVHRLQIVPIRTLGRTPLPHVLDKPILHQQEKTGHGSHKRKIACRRRRTALRRG